MQGQRCVSCFIGEIASLTLRPLFIRDEELKHDVQKGKSLPIQEFSIYLGKAWRCREDSLKIRPTFLIEDILFLSHTL